MDFGKLSRSEIIAVSSSYSWILGSVLFVLRFFWLPRGYWDHDGERPPRHPEYIEACAFVFASFQLILGAYTASFRGWGSEAAENLASEGQMVHALSTNIVILQILAQSGYQAADILSFRWQRSKVRAEDVRYPKVISWTPTGLGIADFCWTAAALATMLTCADPWGLSTSDDPTRLRRWVVVRCTSIIQETVLAVLRIDIGLRKIVFKPSGAGGAHDLDPQTEVVSVETASSMRLVPLLAYSIPVIVWSIVMGCIRMVCLGLYFPGAFVVCTQVEQGVTMILRETRKYEWLEEQWATGLPEWSPRPPNASPGLPTSMRPQGEIDDCSSTPGWHFACSKSGYTDTAISLYWVQHVFDPLTKARAQGKPRLLISDGFGTHESLDILTYCFQNNIIPCRLPSHTSHKLQPCDIGVFGPMKTALREQVERLYWGGAYTIGKQHFTFLKTI